ncbi:MAG: hypothetical protein ACJZ16_03755 [Methylophilaceae bacterium]
MDLDPEKILKPKNNPISIRVKYKYTLGESLPLKNKMKKIMSKAIYKLKIDLAI